MRWPFIFLKVSVDGGLLLLRLFLLDGITWIDSIRLDVMRIAPLHYYSYMNVINI